LNPYIVAFHSQKNVAPKCFDGMTELWTGYSFMFVDVTKSITAQSISEPGSCWREFYMNPLQLCNTASCQISKNEYTFWMPTADIPDTVDVGEHYPQALRYDDENQAEILKYISRCVVCVSDYKLMAVHSYRNQNPDTSYLQQHGWVELYNGYSYMFQSGAKEGSGNQLGEHGSCMQYYSPVSVVQAIGQEVRWISNSPKSVWIINNDLLKNYNLDDGSIQQNVEEGADRKKFREQMLGRCTVMHKSSKNRKILYYSGLGRI